MRAQQVGRTAGIFLLLMMCVGIPGVMFRGIDSSLLADPEFLTLVVEGANNMKLSILLSFLAGVFGLGFVITIFPVLKQHKTYLAIAMVGLWVFQMTVAVIGDVCHYILIEIAQHTASQGGDLSDFLSLGAMMVKGYIGAHFLSLLAYSGAFVFMNVHLLKFGLVPKWLAIWGMIATGTVFTATVLQIFDQDVPFYLYGQNGLYMSLLTIYLLIRGFRDR